MRSFRTGMAIGLSETRLVTRNALLSRRPLESFEPCLPDSATTTWVFTYMGGTRDEQCPRADRSSPARFLCPIRARQVFGFEFMHTQLPPNTRIGCTIS